MSPALLARLYRIDRQTRRWVALDNANGPRHGRYTNVRDFYSPVDMLRRHGS